MNFSDSLKEQAESHRAENIKRLRAQAAMRARDNGFDETCAADAAEHMFDSGATHEEIVSTVEGPYRGRKAA